MQLYFAEGNDIGGANTPMSTVDVPQHGPIEKGPSLAPPLCPGSASAPNKYFMVLSLFFLGGFFSYRYVNVCRLLTF